MLCPKCAHGKLTPAKTEAILSNLFVPGPWVVAAAASIAEMCVSCDPAKGWRETAAPESLPRMFPSARGRSL